jgi:MoxR-like ATPase
MTKIQETGDRVIANVEHVIVGKHHEVRLALVTLIAEGHLLIEDVPGVGKTMLAKAMARSIDCSFRRIQFTPDLLPSDVTGVSVWDRARNDFEFRPGGVFANVVLADEINRASPKTQSALLEAMEERQVSVDAQTYKLPRPFMVIGTQNPVELEGTYPLPEAQLDRFFCKLLVQFPSSAEIETILDRTTEVDKPSVQPVLAGERILEMSQLARQIPIADEVRRYGIAVVLATHPENAVAGSKAARFVRFGASPRGAQSLILGAKIRAILDKRYHVSRDDLRAVAPQVLRHRLILNFEGQADGIEADSVIEDILKTVTEPVLAA